MYLLTSISVNRNALLSKPSVFVTFVGNTNQDQLAEVLLVIPSKTNLLKYPVGVVYAGGLLYTVAQTPPFFVMKRVFKLDKFSPLL
jgi:hypothetical protein